MEQEQKASVDLNTLEEVLVGHIRSEIEDQTTEITSATRCADLKIDSLMIINIIFALEEDYDVAIRIDPDATFETVGDLTAALTSAIRGARAAG